MGSLLLRNAHIWTGVPGEARADAALIDNGRFVFVGRERDLAAPAGVETYDAEGRLVLPGLIDGHAHLLGTGMAMRSVELKDVASPEEAVRLVAERVGATSSGGWVYGAGWDQNLWPGAAFPSRRQLDAVAPDHPVLLMHTSAHCLWANSAALLAANVTATTEAPEGGSIDTDEAGEPTGILRDAAMILVQRAAPGPSREDRLAALRAAIGHALSLGLTSVHAMDVRNSELTALQTLRNNGDLRMRVRAYLSAAQLERWTGNVRSGAGDDSLRVAGVKFFADGALGSLTAWMAEPYEATDDIGLALLPPDELEAQVKRCLDNGLATAIHAIGDRANTEVLDILEHLRDLAPELPRRIEHAQLLAPADIPRFAELGITASMQPIHATQDMAKVDRYWGDRARGAYVFSSLANTGAVLAFGSDSPVETMNPLAGVHAAVTRQNDRGEPAGGWQPDERVSIEAALSAYTSGCSQATGEESTVGKIAPGYLADFVVLSDDLFEVTPERIAESTVAATFVGGEVAYRRDG